MYFIQDRVYLTCLLQQWNARKEIREGSLLINTTFIHSAHVNPHVLFPHLSHVSEIVEGIHRTVYKNVPLLLHISSAVAGAASMDQRY